MAVDPVPDAPAATVETGGKRLLALADFHAGVEQAIRAREGIELDSQAPQRRRRVLELVEATDPDRLVVLGDFMHSIGGPGGAERGEIEVLIERLPVPVTVVRGNHDGAIEEWLSGATVTDARGVRIGSVGFAHGHTWPDPEVLSAPTVCVGHEHPCVRLTDEVGGSRVERVWLRGRLDPTPFEDREEYEGVLGSCGREASADPGGTDGVGDGDGDGIGGGHGDDGIGGGHGDDGIGGGHGDDGIGDADGMGGGDGDGIGGDLVVFPAFNDLSGGTWVNVAGQEFLCPFLPAGLSGGEAYLLDGTRLGAYDRV